jgi:archaellum component FlaC
MAFLKKNGASTGLYRKVKVGQRWKNQKIANLFGCESVDEALKQIPERVNDLKNELGAFVESTKREIQTGWHRRVIERHEEEIEKLNREHKALRQYCDGIENGAFNDGGGI